MHSCSVHNAVLRRRFAYLETVTPSPETTAKMRRQAADADEADVVDSHLTRLEDWNLLRREENGVVRATPKLMTVRI